MSRAAPHPDRPAPHSRLSRPQASPLLPRSAPIGSTPAQAARPPAPLRQRLLLHGPIPAPFGSDVRLLHARTPPPPDRPREAHTPERVREHCPQESARRVRLRGARASARAQSPPLRRDAGAACAAQEFLPPAPAESA